MIESKKVTEHFAHLFETGAKYVWGMNCEEITPESIAYAIKHHSSKTYPRSYYIAKLEEGYGHLGADCSGSFYPVSGFDTTAQGYYSRCKIKGNIKGIPDRPCMVFVQGKKKIDHIGWYDGKGRVIEMRSSKMNVRYDKLDSRWDYWGLPDFVDYSDWEEKEDTIMIELMVLSKGSKGEQVKTAQRLLKAMGYKTGTIDGDFGAKTDKAVRKFQRDAKLDDDGIIGKKTWEALLK